MARVLVLADEDCIRLTCAEVLKKLGFEVDARSLQAAEPDGPPDVVFIWEGDEAYVMKVLAMYGSVPVLVFTANRLRVWPRGVIVVLSPFSSNRVARALHQATRGPTRASALRWEAPSNGAVP